MLDIREKDLNLFLQELLMALFLHKLDEKLWKLFDIFEKYLIQKVLVVALFPRLSKFDAERARWCQTFFV